VKLFRGVVGDGMTQIVRIGGGWGTSVTLLKKEVHKNAQSSTIFGMSRIFNFWAFVRSWC
jgi:hypothetical protein